jgi:hypothetical protein
MSIFKDIVASAKKKGSKIIIVQIPAEGNPKLVTSEEFKELPNIFGKAIAASVKAWVASSGGDLTEDKAMHAFMYAVSQTAQKTLSEIKYVEKHGAEEDQLVERLI